MADQKQYPLFDILAEMLATPQGMALAEDFLAAKDVAGGAVNYATGAPERAIANLQDPPGLTTENAIRGAGDLALLLAGGAGVAGLARAGASHFGKKALGKWTSTPPPASYSAPIGPKLTKDATNYTPQHTEIARDVMRKQLMGPGHMNSKTLATEAGEQFAKRAPNVPPNLNKLAQGSMRRLPDDLDLTSPIEVERAIKMATGWRKGGKATSLGFAGAAAGGTMSDEDIDALLAEIMGGGG